MKTYIFVAVKKKTSQFSLFFCNILQKAALLLTQTTHSFAIAVVVKKWTWRQPNLHCAASYELSPNKSFNVKTRTDKEVAVSFPMTGHVVGQLKIHHDNIYFIERPFRSHTSPSHSTINNRYKFWGTPLAHKQLKRQQKRRRRHIQNDKNKNVPKSNGTLGASLLNSSHLFELVTSRHAFSRKCRDR